MVQPIACMPIELLGAALIHIERATKRIADLASIRGDQMDFGCHLGPLCHDHTPMALPIAKIKSDCSTNLEFN